MTDGPFVQLVKELLTLKVGYRFLSPEMVRVGNALEAVAEPCGTCGGRGKVALNANPYGDKYDTCANCNGTGKDYLAKARQADMLLEEESIPDGPIRSDIGPDQTGAD